MIRVLIVDDQEIVRKGLNIILAYSTGIEVVGFAANGEEAVNQVTKLKPDVVLMDLKMPILNGIHATRRICSAFPAIKVVVLTTYDADQWVFDAIRAGASSYLLKDADGEEIVNTVREVVEGKVHLDPQIAGKILQEFKQLDRTPTTGFVVQRKPHTNDPMLEALTERELSILRLMAQGKSNRDIAQTLFLAHGTVKNNVSQIIKKLHTNDRTQAVLAALRRGIVELV